MATDRSYSDRPMVGFLVPDPRLTYWAAESSLDEADPYPGEVVADQTSDLTITGSGTPETPGTIDLLAISSGVPGIEGAQFAWREDGDARYRGWDFPHVLTRFEAQVWGPSTNQGHRYPQCATSPSTGTIIVVNDLPNTAGGGERRRVAFRRRTSAGAWTSSSTVFEDDDPYTGGVQFMLKPDVIALPDGTFEIYSLTHNHQAESAQLVKHVSVDDGVTWTLTDRAALEVALNTSGSPRTFVNGLAVWQHGGQHLLVMTMQDVGGGSKLMKQWASRDGGATFEVVGDDFADARRPHVVAAGGRFIVSFVIEPSVGNDSLSSIVIGSAFSALSSLTETDIVDSASLAYENEGLAVDETGMVYALVRQNADTLLHVSKDFGATWVTSETSPGLLTGDAGIAPRRGSTCWWRGQLFYVANHDAGTGNHSLLVMQFGGYTDLCMPRLTALTPWWSVTQQTGYSHHWVAIDDPVTTDIWTVAAGGTGAPTFGEDGANSTHGAAATRTYTLGSPDSRAPCIARATLGGDGPGFHRLNMQVGNATNHWEAGLTYEPSSGNITLEELGSTPATIASTSVTANSVVEFMLGVAPPRPGTGDDGECSLWYRIRDAAGDDRQWTHVGESDTLDESGAGATQVEYLLDATTAAGYDLTAFEIGVSFGSPLVGTVNNQVPTELAGLKDEDVNPDNLRGRPFSSHPVYVHDGQFFSAVGVARGGDTWTSEPGHTYAAERVLPDIEPSPSRGFRSLTGGAKALAFQVDTGVDAHAMSDLWGIYLDKINFKNIKIELYQSSAWATLGTLALFDQMADDALGNVIVPSTTISYGDAFVLRRDEIRGGQWEQDELALSHVWEIAANGAGGTHNGAAAAELRTWIRIVPDGTDPGSGRKGYIWYPRALLLLHFAGSNTFEGIRITANPGGTDQEGASGDVRIGTAAMGPIQVMGWAPDETRAVARDLSGDVISKQPDGTTVREELFGQFKRVELSWVRPSRLTETQSDDVNDPDYVELYTTAGGEPVGHRYLAPTDFDGILSEVGRGPIVYCPFLEQQGADEGGANQFITLVRHRANGALYGRYTPSSYRLETITGSAERDEVVRTSVVTLEEEI